MPKFLKAEPIEGDIVYMVTDDHVLLGEGFIKSLDGSTANMDKKNQTMAIISGVGAFEDDMHWWARDLTLATERPYGWAHQPEHHFPITPPKEGVKAPKTFKNADWVGGYWVIILKQVEEFESD